MFSLELPRDVNVVNYSYLNKNSVESKLQLLLIFSKSSTISF